MAFTPIPIGSLNWGAPVNAAFTDHDTRITTLNRMQTSAATDQNLIAWTWDPGTTITASTPTSGTVNMSKIWVREPATVNNVAMTIVTAPTALTAGQNFAALYDSTGARLGVTADQTANWATVGLKDMPLTAPAVIAAGAYYVAFVSNGTTPPAFGRGSSLAAGGQTVNIGLTATDARYTTGPVGQTTLPLSITMAARSIDTRAWWAALK